MYACCQHDIYRRCNLTLVDNNGVSHLKTERLSVQQCFSSCNSNTSNQKRFTAVFRAIGNQCLRRREL